MIGLFLLVVLPIINWGAVEAMLTETLLVPLLIGQGVGDGSALELIYGMLGATTPVMIVGLVGVLVVPWQQPPETWWLPAGTA